MLTAARGLALQKRLHRKVGGFVTTFHVEQISYVASGDPYGAGAATVVSSLLITPSPIIRIKNIFSHTEEDVNASDKNLTLSEYYIDLSGDSITQEQLERANQVVISKGTAYEVKLEVLNYTYGRWDNSNTNDIMAIQSGVAMKWRLMCRGQIVRALV